MIKCLKWEEEEEEQQQQYRKKKNHVLKQTKITIRINKKTKQMLAQIT